LKQTKDDSQKGTILVKTLSEGISYARRLEEDRDNRAETKKVGRVSSAGIGKRGSVLSKKDGIKWVVKPHRVKGTANPDGAQNMNDAGEEGSPR